jgi:hypothetical protein
MTVVDRWTSVEMHRSLRVGEIEELSESRMME